MKLIAAFVLFSFMLSDVFSQTHPGTDFSHAVDQFKYPFENKPIHQINSLLTRNQEKRDSSNFYFLNTGTQSLEFGNHSRYRYEDNTVIQDYYDNSYVLGGRDSIIYNDSGNVLEHYVFVRTGTTWWLFIHFSHHYNDNGDLVEYIQREDNGGGLYNKTRMLYSYDKDGILVERLIQDWLSGFEEWGNYRRETYLNNTNGLVDTTLFENWNTITETYHVNRRQTFMYGSNQELVLSQNDVFKNDLWMNINRNIYFYDDSLRISTWEGYTYSDGEWNPSVKFLYSYDGIGNQLTLTNQSFADSIWLNDYRTVYEYTSENNILTEVNQEFVDIWNTVDSVQHYYTTISSLLEQRKSSQVLFYPNPFSDILHWSIEEGLDVTQLHVYNLSGQLVRSSTINANQNQINLSDLDIGIYIIELLSDQGRIQKLATRM